MTIRKRDLRTPTSRGGLVRHCDGMTACQQCHTVCYCNQGQSVRPDKPRSEYQAFTPADHPLGAKTGINILPTQNSWTPYARLGGHAGWADMPD